MIIENVKKIKSNAIYSICDADNIIHTKRNQ